MDIQNRDNLSKYVTMAFVLVLYCAVLTCAAIPKQVILKSYEKSYSNSNPQECANVISELQLALKNCKDNYLASRIEYRVGVLYFNISDYKNALKEFNALIDRGADYDVLISALNMKANCARFSGQPKEAIVCFQELVNKIEMEGRSSEFENTIIVNSYFSIAQLYEQIGDLTNAIKTYTAFTGKYEGQETMQNFVYKAMEAKADKLFASGDIKSYLSFLEVVLDSDIPEDHKGVLDLQRVCMDFILKNDNVKELNSAAMIPCYALSVAASISNSDVQDLINQMSRLDKKYEKTKSSIYIKYTYAWLLDLSGNKQEALKVFKSVIDMCAKAGIKDRSYLLGEYAKIQSSVLLGELMDYNSAINMVNSLDQPSSGHLLKISEAVKTSLATLKREVPKND